MPSQTKWRNVGWKTSTFFIQRLQTFFIFVTFFTFFNVFYFFSGTFFTSMASAATTTTIATTTTTIATTTTTTTTKKYTDRGLLQCLLSFRVDADQFPILFLEWRELSARTKTTPGCLNQWRGPRPSVGLRTRPVWDQKIGLCLGLVHCGLGLAGLVLCCETRSCHARRHNHLEGHSNFSSAIYSFSILCLEHHSTVAFTYLS